MTRVTDEQQGRLTLARLGAFLIGRREAILAAAQDRSTLWVGFLLVMSAALGREYDGEDLRRQPYHLLISPAVSVVLSLAMFALVRRRDPPRTPVWTEYRRFLGLFWLTAPLALLYAIPYERVLSPAGAVAANLWTLGIVAAWRTALMTRIVHVFTGRSVIASFWLVMLVADVFAVIALLSVPVPVLQLMGGIRLTEAEMMLQNVGYLARFLSLAMLPVWLIGACAVLSRPTPIPQPALGWSSGASVGPLITAAACVMVWALVLPATQREQRLRSNAEKLLLDGRIDEALVEMSRHERKDYPPAWDPPPRIGWPGPEQPDVMDVTRALARHRAAPWVREIFLDKFERRWLGFSLRMNSNRLPQVLALLDELPEGPALRAKHAEILEYFEEHRDRPSASTQPATERGLP